MVELETIEKVRDIFQQGDSRYSAPEDAVLIADLLERNAITIEKQTLIDIEVSEEERLGVLYPQNTYKVIAVRHLKKLGFENIKIEQWLNGAKVDVLAKNSFETIAVECCSCRISKVLEILEKKNTTLWILSLGENGFEKKELPLFIIKRGETWEENFRKYKNFQIKQMRKIIGVINEVLN